ncbi:hypothetical protein TNCV_232341 [Trichonephila clavipes]|nr:hypothetical protein TNCV_232341 [Trichonephila clavipes]
MSITCACVVKDCPLIDCDYEKIKMSQWFEVLRNCTVPQFSTVAGEQKKQKFRPDNLPYTISSSANKRIPQEKGKDVLLASKQRSV